MVEYYEYMNAYSIKAELKIKKIESLPREKALDRTKDKYYKNM